MKNRAFSLVETILTLLLLSIIFIVGGDLAKNFSTFNRSDSETTRRAVASRELLKYLARQSRSALTVATTGSSMTLESLDQSVPLYPPLPLPDGATAPTGWEPDQPRFSTVYQLNGAKLEATRAGVNSVLVDDLTGFQASQTGKLLTLSVSWFQGKRVKTSETKVYLSVRSSP